MLAWGSEACHRPERQHKAEDQPASADIDIGESQHIPEELPISLRIDAVDYGVCAIDHGLSSTTNRRAPNRPV